MTGMTNYGRRGLNTSYYTSVSISLCLLWLFTSATCEPYTFYSMGYPYSLEVGACGIDTIVTGRVPFSDMYLYVREDSCWKVFGGQKDADGLGEEVEYEWLYIKTTYAAKEVRVKIKPNSEKKARYATVETNCKGGSNIISFSIYQEGTEPESDIKISR